jgi:hypothetical protein
MVQNVSNIVSIEKTSLSSTVNPSEKMTSAKRWQVALPLVGALFGGFFLLVLAWACDPASWETVSR